MVSVSFTGRKSRWVQDRWPAHPWLPSVALSFWAARLYSRRLPATAGDYPPSQNIGLEGQRNSAIFCNLVELVMSAELQHGGSEDSALQVYLLGCVDFEALLRLAAAIAIRNRRRPPPGRADRVRASAVDYRGTAGEPARTFTSKTEELKFARWPIRWVNRGGGCVLHGPGQIALLSDLAAGSPSLRHCANICKSWARRSAICLADFSRARRRARASPAASGSANACWRPSASRSAIGSPAYGAYINVHPALDLFRFVTTCEAEQYPMTSLERERRGPVRSGPGARTVDRAFSQPLRIFARRLVFRSSRARHGDSFARFAARSRWHVPERWRTPDDMQALPLIDAEPASARRGACLPG